MFHIHDCIRYLGEIVVVLWFASESKLLQQRSVLALEELVEDMKVPLSRVLEHDSRLLQQVVLDVTSSGSPLQDKID